MATVMPLMSVAQERAWRALFELSGRLGRSWCLVGGQMVHLYCAERGFRPNRPTEDADTVLDVQARPDILDGFTDALIERGWTSAGESLEGHQHRWINDRSQIDVLIPTNVGHTAAGRRGAIGGTTLETRGGQQALDRAELVTVEVADEVGHVPRPNMAGALVIKAAAWTNLQDRYRDRHLTDFALLAAMVQRSDALATAFRPRDVKYLRPTLAGLAARPEVVESIAGPDRGLDVLGRIVNGR